MVSRYSRFVKGAGAFGLALLSACGGGGSGTAVSVGPGSDPAALTVPSKVSVVDAVGGGGEPVSLRAGIAALRARAFPDNSAFATDRTNLYVQEQSVEAFNNVNEILCMVGQTRYEQFLNQGPYTAQVDQNLCAANSGGGNGDQTSGAGAPKYSIWTVDSSRPDNASPQTVRVWIRGVTGPGDEPQFIRAKMVITEGVSQSNPYGLFRIDFAGFPVGAGGEPDTSAPPQMKGFLFSERDPVSGRILIKYAESGTEGGQPSLRQATLDRQADGSEGGGTVHRADAWVPNATLDIAYDGSRFLRSGNPSPLCLDRTQFNESVWRYGLYDGEGNRVQRNSGFPIKVTRNARDYYGWVGYHGLWFPGEVSLSTGDTVYRQSFNGGDVVSTPYQAFVGDGKLFRNSRRQLTLGDILGVALQYQTWNPQGGPGTPYKVVWADNTNRFHKVAQADAQWNWSSASGTVDLSALDWPNLNFWSEALSGNVQLLPLPGQCVQDNQTFKWSCNLSNATPVVVYAQEMVYPGDNTVPAALACFDQCPDADAINDNTSPLHPSAGVIPAPPGDAIDIAWTYAFDREGYRLLEGSTPVVRTAGGEGTPFQGGIRSGALIEPTPENLALLTCDWDNNATCGWNATSRIPVYYTWETGMNSWNRFAGIVSGGDFLRFEPPLRVEYLRPLAGGGSARYFLNYAGFGDLQGIPGTCVDPMTGAKAPCGMNTRWVPEFNLLTGDTVTAGATSYTVKQLEKEQRMKPAPGGCGALSLRTYPLAPSSGWIDPSIGIEPPVSAPPRVIGGVVQ